MSLSLKIKLDENLGNRGAAAFRRAGYDVATIGDENLASASDRTVIDVCREERRCLVTLDLGFSNPFVFEPGEFAGIAVLRLSSKQTSSELVEALDVLIAGLSGADIRGKLWIVQRRRIREYAPDEDG